MAITVPCLPQLGMIQVAHAYLFIYMLIVLYGSPEVQ